MNHAIRIRCAPPNSPDHVRQRFDDLRNERLSVLTEQDTELAPVTRDGGESDLPDHWLALYRFDESENMIELADEISNIPIPGSAWFRVDAHVCDHDEDAPVGCGDWQHIRDRGNVPEELSKP